MQTLSSGEERPPQIAPIAQIFLRLLRLVMKAAGVS